MRFRVVGKTLGEYKNVLTLVRNTLPIVMPVGAVCRHLIGTTIHVVGR